MFDFFFYTFYIFYERREKGGDSVATSSFYVSVIQFLMFYSLITLIDVFSEGVVSMRNLDVNRSILLIAFLSVGAIFCFINLKRFRKKKDEIIAKCKIKTANKWFRVWMMAVMMEILFFSPVLWALLHKAICL